MRFYTIPLMNRDRLPTSLNKNSKCEYLFNLVYYKTHHEEDNFLKMWNEINEISKVIVCVYSKQKVYTQTKAILLAH